MEKRFRSASTYYEEFGRCEARQQTGPEKVTFERRYMHWQSTRTANGLMFQRETDSLYRPGTSVQTEKTVTKKPAWTQTDPGDLALNKNTKVRTNKMIKFIELYE